MWNLKKAEFIEIESKLVVAMGWGWGKWEDTGKRGQTSSYKMNEFWGLICNMINITNNTVLYSWKLSRR